MAMIVRVPEVFHSPKELMEGLLNLILSDTVATIEVVVQAVDDIMLSQVPGWVAHAWEPCAEHPCVNPQWSAGPETHMHVFVHCFVRVVGAGGSLVGKL
jgi:hypothetical protein